MKTSWTGTVKRMVTFAKAGRALRQLKRATSEDARQLARARLAQVLGESRGVAMKIGQLAATDTAGDPLRPLLTGVRPLPLPVAVKEIERALGRPLGEVFASLDESKAAASLGQVHRGVLHDACPVAVKVRYPGIAGAVRAELMLAGLVPGLGPVRKWGFDLTGYKRVLADNMVRELDYRDEARRQGAFFEAAQVRGLVVPRVYEKLCRESLLVQSWEGGARLSEARAWPKRDRLDLGRVLLETLFASLFRAGVVHCDPHAGNYLVRPSSATTGAELVLLDYGSTSDVSRQARLALLKLIVGVREGGDVDVFSGFVSMGFAADKLEPLRSVLPELCVALFRPFLVDGSFRLADWGLGAAFEAACGELKWWFRAAGPPELLLLMRAFQGVCQHLETLDVALPWWPLLEHAVGEMLLAEARTHRLPAARASIDSSGSGRSRLLRVRVMDGANERASLAFPAREALELERLVPEEVARRIARKGLDLQGIQRDLLRRNLAPGEVFKDEHGGTEWRVWLE